MTTVIRWGILGTGSIARAFATGLAAASDAQLVAVGSRSQVSADTFASQFDIPRRHASYEALAADPDVDVIYVATPHPMHYANSHLCLTHGKAVLCEKPFTLNAAETERLIQTARERRLFLMEAMWTRFLPLIVRLRELIASGAIGELRMVSADFGFRTGFNAEHRLFNPALGGGALLDVGIYPLSLASMLLGQPAQIRALAHLGATGVDEQSAVLLGYTSGALALLSCAIRTDTPHEALLAGTAGAIRVHTPWWRGQKLTLTRPGQAEQHIELPYTANGYTHQAEEVGRCLRAGKLESDVMPLDETLALMRTMDAIRAQWNLVYPGEQK